MPTVPVNEAASPNTHLRVLNPYAGTTRVNDAACALSVQVGEALAGEGGKAAGVSSSGYAGTIAHAALRAGRACQKPPTTRDGAEDTTRTMCSRST